MILPDLGLLAFAPPATDQPGNPLFQYGPLILVFLVFYFVVFAPMRKKQKAHGEMLSRLKPGDQVLTNGGIYGKVVGVTDDRIQLKIADTVKIEVAKNAISGLVEA